MTPYLLAAAQAHAAECYPRESCGVVIDVEGVGHYRPCRNLLTEPDSFDLNPDDLARAQDEGRLVAVVHSHPGGPVTPSELDRASCVHSMLPWFIVDGTNWARIDPGLPYEGRRFVMGVDDCWSLAREWYAREKGLDMPDFTRVDKFWELGETPHLDHLAEAGFHPVAFQDMQPGDGILFRVISKQPNHCGVYVGNGGLLHHVPGRLSRVDQLDGNWLERMHQVVRHA